MMMIIMMIIIIISFPGLLKIVFSASFVYM